MSDSPDRLAERRLRDAIETIYRLFEASPPETIDGCPCCLLRRETDVLLTTPLRLLSATELWDYVSGVYLTLGSDRDFRYLLPRILEVSATDPGSANDPEIVLGKLKLANWRSWPAAEQRAIETFVDAWLEQALAADLAALDAGLIGMEAEGVLCGAARAEIPLERWRVRLHRPSAAAVLADMRQRFPGDMSAFWELEPRGFQELSRLLASGPAEAARPSS